MELAKKLIGQRINAALARANKKQKELAQELNVPDNTISYFTSGKRTPNTEQLVKIAEYLDVSADYLLGMVSEPASNMEVKVICEITGLSEQVINELAKYKKDLSPPINRMFAHLAMNSLLSQIEDYIAAVKVANDYDRNVTFEVEDGAHELMYRSVLEIEKKTGIYFNYLCPETFKDFLFLEAKETFGKILLDIAIANKDGEPNGKHP